jgi:hypothetical protein
MSATLRLGPFLLLSVVAACNGQVDDPAPAPDGTLAAAAPTAATATVSLDGVRELDFSRATLGGPRVQGAACQLTEASVSLVRESRVVTWSSCSNESGTLVPVKGVRTLTPEEAALFEAHVQAAAYHEVDPKACAYDGPLFAMNVITGAGEQLYVDDNVNCYTDGRRVAPDVRPLASELWQTASGTAMPQGW